MSKYKGYVVTKTHGPLPLLTTPESIEEYGSDFHPRNFDDYRGQKELKEKLKLYTQAARMRGEALDHLLLFGPPGLGKTTLAQIMAHVMGVSIKICSGPTLERTGDLVALLSGLSPRDILFVDEIHRMPIVVEEMLYSAMEHFRVDVIIGQGAGAQSINLPLNPFTLIGATTKFGMLSAPLRSRFGITERLDFYQDEDLQAIVQQSALFLGMKLSDVSALYIANRSRGTPRIAKKITRRVRDFAQVYNNCEADHDLVVKALSFLHIDNEGLTELDNLILKTIMDRGPLGLDTLAALVGEDGETIEEVNEPFLLRKGYIERTPRGRQISSKILPYLKSKYYGQQIIVGE
jgi:holliday junction DNA helicase RuvB